MNIKADIAIIDSGLDSSQIGENDICGVHFFYTEDDEINLDNDISDEIGHGTAVHHQIRSRCPEASIINIKIFDKDVECQVGLLVEAMRYLTEKCDVKIVNISNGITCCDDMESLIEACNRLYDKGTVIVSAFSNFGAISYPAALDNVIGVDMSLACKHVYDYEYVEGSIVNVRAVGITHRLPWVGGEYKRVSGTSFSCPIITAMIFQKYISVGIVSLEEIKTKLKENANKIYIDDRKKNSQDIFEIHKAIVFPFNKENHSVLRYQELEDFEITNVFDVKNIGNCGRSVSEFISEVKEDHIIKDYRDIDWEADFDTVILGHTRELCRLINKNIPEEIVNKCKEYGKKLVSYEDLRNLDADGYKEGRIYSPITDETDVPDNRFGKLYKIGVPIICVTGTSVKQGKFTLQMWLKKRLMQDGYRVGQLSTEPQACLFNADATYAMGYDSTAYLDGLDEITVINDMLHGIEKKGKDVILVGSQSQTVPYDTCNIKFFPVHQNNLIYACDSDAYVLVCNYYDEDEYIMKTLMFLNHLCFPEQCVAAIAVFPEDNDLQWTCLTAKKKFVSYEDAKKRANEIGEKFRIPTFVLGEENEDIYNACIDFLGGGNEE